MEEELVSVIVPVYNIEDYLPRCLACIEMQTYQNLEIILVDDGSTDGSGRICDEFAVKDSRAQVIHHPENIGLWAARNTGQDAATGDYIWMPDGDDYFHKDIIKMMVEAINRTNAKGEKYNVAFVGYKRTARLDEDVTSEFLPQVYEKSLEEVLEAYVRPQNHLTGRNVWNKLCRRALIDDIRTGNYRYAQDCDFSLKVYLKSPSIVYVDRVMYYWLYRASSALSSPAYGIISNQCLIHLLFDNYHSRYVKFSCCRRYILEFLYQTMALLLEMVQKTDWLPSVRQECKKIVRQTWIAYLNSKTIQSFKKRLSRVLKISFDKLYRGWLWVIQ